MEDKMVQIRKHIRESDAFMRLYDVYRHNNLAARVRILESGEITWAYRQHRGTWQGFWWSNDTKRNLEDLIIEYPDREEIVMSEFRLRRVSR
jgi:hypothetical protein